MEVVTRMLDPMGVQTPEVETVDVVTADLVEIREEVVTAAADAIAEEAVAVINRQCGNSKTSWHDQRILIMEKTKGSKTFQS